MKYLVLVPLLLIISCAENSELKQDDQAARDTLVGIWRGEGDYQDEDDRGWREHWKMNRHQDGSYEVSYLMLHDENKQYELSSDSGKWGYENGRYFEVDQYEQKSVFKVASLKKDNFQYNYIQRSDDIPISETKTGEGFKLQNPPEGYTEFVYQESEVMDDAE